jgi:WD40 repeat protein
MVFWDVASGKARVSLNLNSNANLALNCSALSPDWKTLAVTNAAGTIKLWDLETGQERGTIKGADDRVYHVEFSPDGKVLALVAHVGAVKFLRTATEQEVHAQSGRLDPRQERAQAELKRATNWQRNDDTRRRKRPIARPPNCTPSSWRISPRTRSIGS